jgi:hypothetical protein
LTCSGLSHTDAWVLEFVSADITRNPVYKRIHNGGILILYSVYLIRTTTSLHHDYCTSSIHLLPAPPQVWHSFLLELGRIPLPSHLAQLTRGKHLTNPPIPSQVWHSFLLELGRMPLAPHLLHFAIPISQSQLEGIFNFCLPIPPQDWHSFLLELGRIPLPSHLAHLRR